MAAYGSRPYLLQEAIMPHPDTITISIDRNLAEDERESLLLTLRDHAEIQAAEPRDLTAALLVFVAVMKGIGAVAGGAAAVLTLAEKIKAWRDRARACGVEPKVQLDRPDRPRLDLTTASDAEVSAWFQDNPRAC